ncbi:hypothetical protein [Parasphingorhabdus sp.]|jgi:hypothetical protein|uniref:hypothetical protein n=1 Tax=Parasphingorhabdus sp. TaxID=2709688 RepID=UPI003D27955D
MHNRLYKKIGVLGLIALTAGCVQATRHSNTMIFGTSTNVGVKVGQNVNQVPEILIGYDRQEAVIMPLWANTEDEKKGNLLSPCLIEDEEYGEGPHPCAFVASRQDGDKKYAEDSYSVLASFGAQIEGSGSGPEAQVGLAQYFATGMAAQILALTGGASIVAVGDAAEKAAETAPQVANALPTLFGKPFAKNDKSVSIGSNYAAFEKNLYAKIKASSAGNLQARITAFETRLNVNNASVRTQCGAGKDACISEISIVEPYYDGFVSDEAFREKAKASLTLF